MESFGPSTIKTSENHNNFHLHTSHSAPTNCNLCVKMTSEWGKTGIFANVCDNIENCCVSHHKIKATFSRHFDWKPS